MCAGYFEELGFRAETVSVAIVRELLGVMTAAGVKEGVIATTSTFTPEARSFAMGKEIYLIDGEDLIRKLHDLAPERQKSFLVFVTDEAEVGAACLCEYARP